MSLAFPLLWPRESIVTAVSPLIWDDPADQRLLASALVNVTFPTPTGNVGPITYSVEAFNQPAGSAISPAGSGLSYSFTPVVEGTYTLELDAYDAVQNVHTRATFTLTLDLADPPLTFSDPADQSTTTLVEQSVTFSAATGGTGSKSYSAVLVQPAGGTATLSGSGVGPYTFTPTKTGTHKVVNTVTDSRGVTFKAIGVVNVRPDVLPPSRPAAQLKALDTTSTTITFGYHSGPPLTTTPPTVVIEKLEGSATPTLTSITDNLTTGWDVVIGNLTNGVKALIELEYSSDSQKAYRSCMVVVTNDTVTVWDEIAEIDFTDCTAIDVSATGSTHQVLKGDGVTNLIQCIRTFSSSTSATCSYNFVNGTGLVLSQSTAAVDARNGTLGLDLVSAGLTLNLHEEAVYIEVLTTTCELEQVAGVSGQVLNLSIQDTHTATGQPAFGYRCERDSATTADDKIRKRFAGTSTNSAGVTNHGVEIPVTNNFGFLLLGGHKAFVMRDVSATYMGPQSLPDDYQGTAYGDTTASVDSYADNWTGAWLVWSATNQTVIGGATTCTIKKLKVWKKQPVS